MKLSVVIPARDEAENIGQMLDRLRERPFLSPHFNLTVKLPLKAIARGCSYEVIPIRWQRRLRGASSLRLKEMGGWYLFIVLYVWLGMVLTRGDCRRSPGKRFAPWVKSRQTVAIDSRTE